MIKKYAGLLAALTCLLLNLSACHREEEMASFNAVYDVLKELRPLIHEETHRIDFSKNGNAQRHLLQGWSFQEETHIWGIGLRSSIVFYRYDRQQDVDMQAKCWTIPGPPGTQQEVRVHLNGNALGAFSLIPGQENRVMLTLPASGMQFGRNSLEFLFRYSTKGRESASESKEKRDISVSFQEIRFSESDDPELIFFENGKLLQKSGAPCALLAQLPKAFEVDAMYQSLKGNSAFIEFVDENGSLVKKIALSSRKERHQEIVRLQDAGLYQIHLFSRGSAESSMVWKHLMLNMYQEEELASGGAETSQGFTKSMAVKPDILLYVVDTLRVDHVSCYGYSRKTTPSLDRFAEEGTVFTHAYAPSSWTKPSGASLLTGLLPKHHNTMERDDKLPQELVTLAEQLRQNGYYTAAFSANGNIAGDFGFGQGFDKFHVFPPNPKTLTINPPANKVNEKIFAFLDSYQARGERKPLFMLVWTIDPHDPYAPPEEVQEMFGIERYQPVDTFYSEFIADINAKKIRLNQSQIEFVKARYDQEVYFNDLAFGALLDKMKALHRYDDAIILFTSDHGEEFFDHGGVFHGSTLYNEQIHIPFIIKTPFLEKGVWKGRFQLIDVYPSLLDMLGLQAPYPLDGLSLLDSSPQPDERILYFEERFSGNDLVARLDRRKKVIFNHRFFRPLLNEDPPRVEMFDAQDTAEQLPLPLTGITDDYRVQQILSYINSIDESGVSQDKVDLSPELDQKLKDLGYVK